MTTTSDTARAEAVAWLVGRLRFEQLLAELQERVDETGQPVELVAAPAPAAARAA
jgi:hypothetical protein